MLINLYEPAPAKGCRLLAHPFRIFFVLTAVYALCIVLGWLGFILWGWPLRLGDSPLHWHSHEMLYGFVMAAIAGFMLTAMTNWTGAAPLSGKGLLALVGLWLLGRMSLWFAAWLPAWLVALVDLAFIPVLAIYVTRVLILCQNYRNLMLVAVLTLLFIGNLLMQLGFVYNNTAWLRQGQSLGFDVISLLIVIIAGRIIPAFTGNWLRLQGRDPAVVRKWPAMEVSVLVAMLGLLLAELLAVPQGLVGALALLAALLNGVRLLAWSGWQVAREPLLWILHLAYLWLVVALVLRGLSYYSDVISPSLWQHALGVGAMATLILGVMTRVAVGHTGRKLELLGAGLGIYLAIISAGLLRVLSAAGLLEFRLGINLSALAWVLAFGWFLVVYGPVLARPRADGMPG